MSLSLKSTLLAVLVGTVFIGSTIVEAVTDGVGPDRSSFQPAQDDDSFFSQTQRYIVCPNNAKGRAMALENAEKLHLEMKSVDCVAVSMPAARAAALSKNPRSAILSAPCRLAIRTARAPAIFVARSRQMTSRLVRMPGISPRRHLGA